MSDDQIENLSKLCGDMSYGSFSVNRFGEDYNRITVIVDKLNAKLKSIKTVCMKEIMDTTFSLDLVELEQRIEKLDIDAIKILLNHNLTIRTLLEKRIAKEL